MPKEKINKGGLIRSKKSYEQAESLFVAYCAMAGKRTMKDFHRLLGGLGVKIAIATLENYSTKFNWVDRVKQYDIESTSNQESEAAIAIKKMNEDQSKMGEVMQRVGYEGLSKHLMTKLSSMTFSDADRLISSGQRVQRLAMGEATDRHELAVQIVEPLVRQIVMLFERVNRMDNQQARASEFALGADAIIIDNFPRGND